MLKDLMNRYVNDGLRNTLRSASRMIQSGRLMELTTAIQKSLAPGADTAHAMEPKSSADVIDVEARVVGKVGEREEVHRQSEPMHAPGPAARDEPTTGGQFIDGAFTNPAGTRSYKLYIPAGATPSTPLPLVVMLHGCTQNPDDFAAGTGANALADEMNFYVLYPAQAKVANVQKCWNWFQPGDQVRGQGEPSLIADMTREVMKRHGIDRQRVYVAGMSAGGAMAVTMATTYPDLYAAAGVHSGLPHAIAHDVMSAMAAMRQGAGVGASAHAGAAGTVFVPTIVFHGDGDATVHPCNGEQIIVRSKSLAAVNVEGGRPPAQRPAEVESGRVPGGHAWTRTIHRDADGATLVEHWVVHGAGHTWSGGRPAGSYTDSKGPDATRAMLRFFLDHPLRARH